MAAKLLCVPFSHRVFHQSPFCQLDVCEPYPALLEERVF